MSRDATEPRARHSRHARRPGSLARWATHGNRTWRWHVQALERSGAGTGRPALCAAHAAANLLRSEVWQECPTWAALLCTSRAAPHAQEAGPGDWPHGWQFHASRALAPTVPCGLTDRLVAHCHTHEQVLRWSAPSPAWAPPTHAQTQHTQARRNCRPWCISCLTQGSLPADVPMNATMRQNTANRALLHRLRASAPKGAVTKQ